MVADCQPTDNQVSTTCQPNVNLSPSPLSTPSPSPSRILRGKPATPEPKEKHLDFVFLTEKEFHKLCDEQGNFITQQKIKELNDYIGSKGVKYKSHYYTILSWINKEKKTNKPAKIINYKDVTQQNIRTAAEFLERHGETL